MLYLKGFPSTPCHHQKKKENKQKNICLFEHFSTMSLLSIAPCQLDVTTSPEVSAYRDVVSTSDCTSILPVMCLGVVARKKTPEKRKEKKENKNKLLRI